MKITRLKLVNFIGIKHGTSLDEIEIDFEKNGKGRKIVMLNGGNGSGKSTILSQLHPFKDSFDERKTLIMEDKEGLKEIDIRNGEDFYEIKHMYGKTAKSFIKKNGTEMNENGGVKTFNSFIENEFGLTSDYFKIGKIGSNTSNFIQFTTSERKTYISKFLPDIQDYLDKFEIVKEKFKTSTDTIKNISSDLGKLEEKATVENKIKNFEDIIKGLDSDIERLSNNMAVLQSEITKYREDISAINSADLILERNQKEKLRNDIILKGMAFIKKYNGKKDEETCNSIILQKTENIKSLGENIAVLNNEKTYINNNIINAENEIKKTQYNLEGLNISDKLEDIIVKINNIETKIKSIKLDDVESVDLVKNNKDISVHLSKFESFMNFILKYFSNLRDFTINPNQTNIEFFMSENFPSTLDSHMNNMRLLIQGKQSNLSVQESKVLRKQEDLIKYDKIYNKDTNGNYTELCNTCPFLKDAIEYKNLPGIIEKLNIDISQIKKDLNEFNVKAENLTELKALYQNFNLYFDQLNPRTNQVYIYFINKYGNLINLILENVNKFKNSFSETVENVNKTIYNIQEISNLKTELENLKYKKNIIENNESIRNQYNNIISEKNIEIEKYKKEIIEKSNLLNKYLEDLNLDKEVLSDYSTYLQGKKDINNLATEVNNLNLLEKNYNEKVLAITTKTNEVKVLNDSLLEVRNRRFETDKQLIEAKTNLATIESLISRKALIETDYNYLKLIKDSLDPNKGIPLYFIKAYLEKTKDITNDLLNLAFDGTFEINFITSASDFFIQVRTGDNIKNDIKEASQGEVALTTISISLALIEQSIGSYNILALDEIDGPLDTSNRENFISILNRQIDKLGIEQVFVISHNDAFDSEEMDLILLKDHKIEVKGEEFIKNKEIIFELK